MRPAEGIDGLVNHMYRKAPSEPLHKLPAQHAVWLRSQRALSWFESLGHAALLHSHIRQRCNLLAAGCCAVLLLTLLGSTMNSVLHQQSVWAAVHYSVAMGGSHRSIHETAGPLEKTSACPDSNPSSVGRSVLQTEMLTQDKSPWILLKIRNQDWYT